MSAQRFGASSLVLAAFLMVSACGASDEAATEPAAPDAPASPAARIVIDPHTLAKIGEVDERYQSYNVEMAEVIGGRFWRPYANALEGPENINPDTVEVGKTEALFEKRDPADLYNEKLRNLASALGPAYMRVSGTWANAVYVQDNDDPQMAEPPEGFTGVLTRAQWKGVVDFAKAVDAEIVTSFSTSEGVRDENGVWSPTVAAPLFAYTEEIGGKIVAAEPFNEPNMPAYGHAPPGYDAAAYGKDVAALTEFLEVAAPDLVLAGPGHVAIRVKPRVEPIPTEDLLTTVPKPGFEVYSYHFYGAVSQRCARPGMPGGTTREDARSEEWLAVTEETFMAEKAIRDELMPGAKIWLTETAGAACGGNPWSATYLDTFRYADTMGRLAKDGLDALFHNTLSASEYGLIDDQTLDPRPNYWAAVLWRRTMGTGVLDISSTEENVRLYAHCQRDVPGGVGVLAINLGDEASSLGAETGAETYTLTAPVLDGGDVDLNGSRLSVDESGTLPAMTPAAATDGVVALPPASVSFIAYPDAGNPACQ